MHVNCLNTQQGTIMGDKSNDKPKKSFLSERNYIEGDEANTDTKTKQSTNKQT